MVTLKNIMNHTILERDTLLREKLDTYKEIILILIL